MLVFGWGWGCGDDDGGAGDASPGGDGAVAAGDVMIPWLSDGAPAVAAPDFGACPDGWQARDEDGVTLCEPYPDGPPEDCGLGEAHLPGTSGCMPLGSACPTGGDWADTLPTDRPIVYVSAGATGGDGTMGAPWGSLVEFSLARLASGTVIALARGRYDEEVRLPGGVTLWGACAAETELANTVPNDLDGAVVVLGADAELRDLSITSTIRTGLTQLLPDTSVHLAGVEISGSRGIGIYADDGTVTADRIAIRDIVPAPSGSGRGVQLEVRGAAELSHAAIERTHDLGAFVAEAGTRLSLTDSVVRDTLSDGTTLRFGRAITAQDGATVDVARSVFVANREAAVSIRNPGTTATVADVVVRDTAATELDGTFGRAIEVTDGAVVTVDRALLSHAKDDALAITAGATVDASDVLVRDVDGRTADGIWGMGFLCEAATATVTRMRIVRARSGGVHAVGPTSSVTATDLAIVDVLGSVADGSLGRGINVEIGAHVEASHVVVQAAQEMGVFASDAGATLTLRDASIMDTAGVAVDGSFGRGASAQEEARFELERVLVAGAHELGVVAMNDASVSATDLVVRDVEPTLCADTSCADTPGGHGLGAYYGGSMAVERFVVERAALCGVHVATPDVELATGVVRDATIGACVQATGYDVARLGESIRYEDNATNLQTTDLPLPETAGGLPGS